MKQRRKALREMGRLFRAKTPPIWLFISNKAGFSPEGCSINSTNSQLAFLLAYQDRGVAGRIVASCPEGMWEKKIRHWEGFHFLVQQLSDWHYTFLAWEGKASWVTATPIPPTLKTGLEIYIPQNKGQNTSHKSHIWYPCLKILKFHLLLLDTWDQLYLHH